MSTTTHVTKLQLRNPRTGAVETSRTLRRVSPDVDTEGGRHVDRRRGPEPLCRRYTVADLLIGGLSPPQSPGPAEVLIGPLCYRTPRVALLSTQSFNGLCLMIGHSLAQEGEELIIVLKPTFHSGKRCLNCGQLICIDRFERSVYGFVLRHRSTAARDTGQQLRCLSFPSVWVATVLDHRYPFFHLRPHWGIPKDSFMDR